MLIGELSSLPSTVAAVVSTAYSARDLADASRGNAAPPEELWERNYLNREVRENEEATTTGGFSAICGWGSSI